MHVESILKTKGSKVLTVVPQATVAEAVELLSRHGIGAVVVSADGAAVLGILSERDVVRALAKSGTGVLEQKVASLMTMDVFTCEPEDTVGEIMSMMTTRRIRHLPVMRDGQLSGIVSIGDAVKHRLEEIEMEASSLRNFIVGAGPAAV